MVMLVSISKIIPRFESEVTAMNSIAEKTDIKVLKSYPQEKVWNVVISFPEAVAGYRKNITVAGPLDYVLYQIQGWTDEPVDLNEISLMAYNENTTEYKLVKGDDASVPERIQTEMLDTAREAMLDAENTLSNK
jgi:hypothetical protein